MNYKKRSCSPTKYIAALMLVGVLFLFSACIKQGKLGTYQKEVSIPDHAWSYDFKPEFSFQIKDTSARYNVFITIRHTNQYPYSNLWVMIYTAYEGVKPQSKRVELPLADKTGKWLGSGIGDIFDQRIPVQHRARFDKIGTYHIKLEQNMRINPLPHVMSVGLRVEKISP